MKSTFRLAAAVLVLVVSLALLSGCVSGPRLVPAVEQTTIDRRFVEYPAGFELKPYVVNLSAPTAIAFDSDGAMLIAESGGRDDEPHVFGYRPDGSTFEIYPILAKFPLRFFKPHFRIYGPIGGMVASHGRVYVSHRDESGRGVITAFDAQGNPTTIVADLPAQGDFGVTDLAASPNGRIYFGVGTATNSGVVGIDNWAAWVRDHPDVCDAVWWDIKLLGFRFDSPNPRRVTIFSGPEIAVTGPFQAFGRSNQTWIRKSPSGKPTGAIYSVAATGGDLRVEAHGLHYPRGLAFNEFGRLYMTNQGMELRGTRPLRNDPDVLLRLVPGTWYGWPDYSADLQPVTDERFQPGSELMMKSGYPDVSFLIDHATSGLMRPDRNTLLEATFAPMCGAAKMDFAPASGPFREFRGSAVIALSGDRAPFATGGEAVPVPSGYKLLRVDVDNRQVHEFVRNTHVGPASAAGGSDIALERPIDVKFGPDGAMYILDFGRMTMKLDGKQDVSARTGRIYKLEGIHPDASSRP